MSPRSRRRTAAGMALVLVGLVTVALGMPEVDFSVSRYLLFVGGGVAAAGGLLALSRRAAAILVLVVVAGIAAEGPIRGGDAEAIRLLARVQLPAGFATTIRGFEGNGRGLPFRVLVGPEGGVDPASVGVPSGFSVEPLGYDFAHTVNGHPIESDWTQTFLEGGYAPIASWRGFQGGRTCQIDLDAADPKRVAQALTTADGALRSRFHGRSVIRLVSFCLSGANPGVPRPGSKPRSTPAREMTPEQVGGPR